MTDNFRYENHLVFENNTIGKIVIAIDRGDENLVKMFGMAVKSPISLNGITDFGIEVLLNSFGYSLDEIVGMHKDIPVGDSRIIGGAEFAFFNGDLYVSGSSAKFGGVHKDIVGKCVGEKIKIHDAGLRELYKFKSGREWILYG